MKTSFISMIPLAVLAFACPATAQVPAETILPAIIPASQTHVKADNAATTPSAAAPAMAQASAETILPAILPASQTHVKADNAATTTPGSGAPVRTTGVVVNPTPTRPAVSPPHATVFSENSSPSRDQTVNYYLPVGAISPRSGIRTYPGITAARITNGATRASTGILAGSTLARLAGGNGSRASRPSSKARTVGTR